MKIVVKGAWNASYARRFKMLRADHVELNHAKGFDIESSLAFLPQLAGLRRLTIILPGSTDISPVAECRELEQLSINISGSRKAVKLGQLDRLRELSIEMPAMVADLYDLVGLTSLFIGRYPAASLEPLGRLMNLTSVRLYQARELLSLDGIQHLPELSALEIAGARKLTDIGALPAARQLQKLDISNAVAVGDWSPVGELRNLRWLSFEDVKSIDSLEFVNQLELLEKLFATGTTKIADGRVAQLGFHSRLRKVVLAESRGHDATDAEIQRKLGRFTIF